MAHPQTNNYKILVQQLLRSKKLQRRKRNRSMDLLCPNLGHFVEKTKALHVAA
jgi:hypothetical protein